MQLTIVDRDVRLDEQQRAQIERRIRFALARYDSRLEQVSVELTDVTGPRGKQAACRLVVRWQGQKVDLRDQDERWAECVARLAERAARTVARGLERSHPAERRHPLSRE